MTTLNQAKEAVYQRFVDNFTGVSADRITFDNEEFEAPSTGNWVRLVVRSQVRTQDTLGKKTNRKFREAANVIIQIFTRVNTGVSASDALVKEARDIYEGESFSGLDFQSVSTREAGPQEGTWYLAIVEAPFDYEEIK